MTEISSDTEAGVEVEAPEEKKKQKGQKPKKRPSDFEIVRTILQRTHERKLPYILKNMGEDSDILLLCSEDEDGFVYGSSDMTIAMIEFEDPELEQAAESILTKMHGYDAPNQILINARDQISELAKTKGETIDVEVEKDEYGSVWSVKKDIRGQERTLYFSRAIESLFHFQMVKHWCSSYRHLLKTQDPAYLYYPYNHPDGSTYTILTLPPSDDKEHPIRALYPNGFRTSVTRGIDMLITKMIEPHFPYQVVSEEVIVFIGDGSVCQMAHRVVGEGWRMVIIRPNAVLFPTLTTPLSVTGPHVL